MITVSAPTSVSPGGIRLSLISRAWLSVKQAAEAWPSWDPARAAREFQASEVLGMMEDIIEGNGSGPVGPKAASNASADNP
jgi:hypothetical protein